MSEAYSDVVQSVNSSLDARAILEELGIHPKSIVAIASRLKSHCPVHKGDAFKSLQVDSVNRTCQCILKECAAHTPMTLVSLYALVRRRGELAAALDLANQFNIPLSTPRLQAIYDRNDHHADEAERGGDYHSAAEFMAVAFFAKPNDVELAEKLASMRDRAGDEKGAAEAFLFAARLSRQAGNIKKAANLLEQKASVLDPENRQILIELSQLQRERDADDSSWARTLFLHAQVAAGRDRDFESALENLEVVATKLKDDPAVYTYMAEILLRLGRVEEGIERLLEAARCHARDGEEEMALAMLEEVLEKKPTDISARRLAAEIRARKGDRDTFRREMELLATEALEVGDESAAEGYCQTLIENVPGNLFSCDMLAKIYAARGDLDRQTDMLFYAADIAAAGEYYDKAIDYLDVIRSLPAKGSHGVEKLAAAYLQLGNPVIAKEQYYAAAIGYLKEEKADRARSCSEALARLVPIDVAMIVDVANKFSDLGMSGDGTGLLLHLGHLLQESGQYENLQSVVDELRAREVDSDELDELELEAAVACENEDRIVSGSVRAAKKSMEALIFTSAEDVLKRALDKYPDDPRLNAMMAKLFRTTSRLSESRPFSRKVALSAGAGAEERTVALGEALAIDEADAELQFQHGAALEGNGDTSAAWKTYRVAAVQFLAEGKLDEAQKALERAMNLAPEENDLLEVSADIALRRGDLTSAEELYIVYLQRMAVLHDEAEVRSAFERVVAKFPSRMNIHRAHAEWLDSVGDTKGTIEKYLYIAEHHQVMEEWQDALDAVERLMTLKRDVYSALHTRAELLQKLGRMTESVDALREAGWCAAEEGNHREVILCFDDVAAVEPLTDEEQTIVAEAYKEIGAKDKALSYFGPLLERKRATGEEVEILDLMRSILKLDPSRLALRQEYAKILKTRGEADRAAEEYEALAGTLLLSGEREEAWDVLQLSKSLNPDALGTREMIISLLAEKNDAEAVRRERLELVDVHTRAGCDQKAAELLKDLLKDAPGDVDLLEKLGVSQAARGDENEARETLLQAANIHETSGRYDEAIHLMDCIAVLVPADLGVAEHLASLLRKNQQTDRALDVYLALLERLLTDGRENLVDHVLSETLHAFEGDWDRFLKVVELLNERHMEDDAAAAAESFMERCDANGYVNSALCACNFILTHHSENSLLKETQALYLAALGEYADAARKFDQLIDATEKNGNGDESLRLARLACERVPKNDMLTNRLIEALFNSQSATLHIGELLEFVEKLRAAGQVKEARILLERMVRTFDENIELAFALIDLQIEEGNAADAGRALRQIAERNEVSDSATAKRAHEKLVITFPDSLKDFEAYARFLATKDGVSAAVPMLSQLLRLHAEQKASAKTFRKKSSAILEVANGDPQIRKLYAELLNKKGDASGAVQELLSLAHTLKQKGEWPAAIGAARAAHSIHESTEALEIEVDCAEMLGDATIAEASLRDLSIIYRKNGDSLGLLNALRKSRASRPNDPQILRELASLYHDSALHEDEKETLQALATTLRNVGDVGEHITVLQQLLSKDAGNRGLVDELTRLLAEVGRTSEAAQVWLTVSASEQRDGQLDEALRAAERARDVEATALAPRLRTMELKFALGRFEDFVNDAEGCVRWHLNKEERDAAISLLVSNVTRLIEGMQFAAGHSLLSSFDDLVQNNSALKRLKALSLEGAGREKEASLVWIDLTEILVREGKHEEAETALRRLIALDPKSIPLRRRLISSLRNSGSSRQNDLITELREFAPVVEIQGPTEEFASVLLELLELDPFNLEALDQLARISMKSENQGRAAELYLRLGDAQHEIGNTSKATAAYRDALTQSPDHILARERLIESLKTSGKNVEAVVESVLLAESLEKTKRPEDALTVYTSLLSEGSRDARVMERAAAIHVSRGENEEAVKLLTDLFHLHTGSGKLPEARKALAIIESLKGSDATSQELLGDLYLESGDAEEAAKCLKSAAQRRMNDGELSESLQLVDRAIKINATDKQARRLRADVLLQTERLEQAAEELVSLAALHQMDNEVEQELESLREAATWFPDHLIAVERLAFLLSDLDEPVQAFDEFMSLAVQKEKRQDRDGAIEALKTGAMLQPDRAEPHVSLARLFQEKADLLHARISLNWLAEHYEKKGEHENAITALERLLQFSRDHALIERLAALLVSVGDKAGAAHLYAELMDWAERENDDKAAFAAAQGLRNSSAALQPDILRRVAGYYLRSNQQAEAVDAYLETFAAFAEKGEIESAQQLLPSLGELEGPELSWKKRVAEIYLKNGIPELAAKELIELGQALERQKKSEEALEVVQRALALTPDTLQGSELRFKLLLDLARNTDAADAAEKLIRLSDERGNYNLCASTAKQLTVLRPNDDEARVRLIKYLRITQQFEVLTDEMRHLAESYMRKDESRQASEVLKSILQILPDDTRARSQYIDSYRLVGSESDLILDYAKLAEIHTKHGDVVEATRTYEKIFHIDPNNLELRDKFIEFLLVNGQTARAISETYQLVDLALAAGHPRKSQRALERVSRHVGNDADFHYLLGRVYRDLNSRGIAAKQFEFAADLYHSNGQAGKQIEVLRDLLKIDSLNLEVRQRMIEVLVASSQGSEAISEMEELGRSYLDRGLPDLAEAEFRKITAVEPRRISSWELLIEALEKFAKVEDIAADYVTFAQLLLDSGDLEKSLRTLKKVSTVEISDLDLRKSYIDIYLQVGDARDLSEDVVSLAEELVHMGRIDEAVCYFEKAMAIDPMNAKARDLLSATQSRVLTMQDGDEEIEDSAVRRARELDSSLDLSGSQLVRSNVVTASEYLHGAINSFERQDSEEALLQIVNNYQDILSINPQNAGVRLKLAEVHEQMGQISLMLHQLSLASEILFNKNELTPCVSACERYLRINPADQRVRKRMNDAILKRDAYKVIESALLFPNDPDSDPSGRG